MSSVDIVACARGAEFGKRLSPPSDNTPLRARKQHGQQKSGSDADDHDICPVQEGRACRTLWCEVFLASLTDAWSDPTDRWVGTRDFFIVAALAGIDHDIAGELVTALHARHARLRANAAAGHLQGKGLPVGILRRAR